MIGLMWVGRLEIIPVVVLVTQALLAAVAPVERGFAR